MDTGSAQTGEQREIRREYFEFSGTGSEYFRIWTVNTLLTIVTLGLYSPWAKVRKLRYIYGSTRLADGRFDYHANPLVILRGRAIALGALLLTGASQAVFPPLYLVLIVLLFASVPWLIVRARMFNMRYTSYRNVRFGFARAYAQSYKAIYLYGLLAVITFGLAVPYAHYQRSRFIVTNTRFGTLPFHFARVAGTFFWVYYTSIFFALIVLAPLGYLTSQIMPVPSETDSQPGISVLPVLATLGVLAGYYLVAMFIKVGVLQATTDATSIGLPGGGEHDYELRCDWNIVHMMFIYFTNVLAIVCSLGLLIPWAQMRVMRYQLRRTWIETRQSLATVSAAQQDEVSALGEEIGDVFDVDIGI